MINANNGMRTLTDFAIDARGRVYRTTQQQVSPIDGSTGPDTLATGIYYDGLSSIVATSAPGGIWTKNVYDGAVHKISTFITDGTGDDPYSFDTDNVLSSELWTFDNAGNPIRIRSTDYGPVGSLTMVTYNYFDAANRLIDSIDLGTNPNHLPYNASGLTNVTGGVTTDTNGNRGAWNLATDQYHWTSYQYDAAGNLRVTTVSLGAFEQLPIGMRWAVRPWKLTVMPPPH